MRRPNVLLLFVCLRRVQTHPKPPLRAAPIAVQYNGADWVVSLVQAMVYLPPLVPVIRDAAIGDSLSPVWSAFVSLARRVRTRSLGALPLAGLVESLASAFEALLSDLGSGARRSPESALDLLTVPAGSVFSSAFGADVQRQGSPFVAAREGGGSVDSFDRCCWHYVRPGSGRGCCVWVAGSYDPACGAVRALRSGFEQFTGGGLFSREWGAGRWYGVHRG
mgnify:CR=1 FL=1